VTFVATGCLTNLALLLSVYPEVAEVLEEIIIMGGSTGRGNTGPAAEFNIQVDPEAAAIVFSAGIPLTMVPLDVTHTTLVTDAVLQAVAIGPPPRFSGLSGGGFTSSLSRLPSVTGAAASPPSPMPPTPAAPLLPGEAVPPRADVALAASVSPFRKLLVSLLSFFASTYDTTFGMPCPPLHDPVAVLFASPEHRALFKTRKCRVDIETTSPLSAGQTVVDLLNVGGHPPERLNATVALSVDVPAFWKAMLDAVTAADARSPMNPAPAYLLSSHATTPLPPLPASVRPAPASRDGAVTPSRNPVLPPLVSARADVATAAPTAGPSEGGTQADDDARSPTEAARPITRDGASDEIADAGGVSTGDQAVGDEAVGDEGEGAGAADADVAEVAGDLPATLAVDGDIAGGDAAGRGSPEEATQSAEQGAVAAEGTEGAADE